MSKPTQSQIIQQHNEEEALAFFKSMLASLPDPRRPQGIRYPLVTIVCTALMAMVCGCDDAESIEEWSFINKEWLSGFLPMPHGSPTQDVYLSVMAALNPKAFQNILQSWAALLVARLQIHHKHVSIDGKTSRRSFDHSQEKTAIHTVSAWLNGAGLVLAQTKVKEKSNEIIGMRELLEMIDISGTTITIDAIGCQKDFANKISNSGGHYILSVKDNQPTLHQEIQETFKEADNDRRRTLDEEPRPQLEEYEHTDGGHGRVEIRRVRVCKNLAWTFSAPDWKNLSSLIEVKRTRTILSKNETSTETRYFISSNNNMTAKEAGDFVRNHWGIENSLHWVLDMAFREDEARHRAKNTAQNMNIIRHFALNIIKQDTSRKLGVANSRKRAGWDRQYLLHLLTAAAI